MAATRESTLVTRLLLFLAGLLVGTASAQEADHAHHGGHHAGHHGGHGGHNMSLDAEGMVMHQNHDELPRDCAAMGEDIEISVEVGTAHAQAGLGFGYDTHQWRVPPCSRLTVNLINRDDVRHQWMVHGLPRYLYPQGMFHLEVSGGATKTGTFIVPSDDATYLVHCDISQHMEKGLKAQLVVGAGSGDLPGVPGISGMRFPDEY